jgi:hypothetical protein
MALSLSRTTNTWSNDRLAESPLGIPSGIWPWHEGSVDEKRIRKEDLPDPVVLPALS